MPYSKISVKQYELFFGSAGAPGAPCSSSPLTADADSPPTAANAGKSWLADGRTGCLGQGKANTNGRVGFCEGWDSICCCSCGRPAAGVGAESGNGDGSGSARREKGTSPTSGSGYCGEVASLRTNRWHNFSLPSYLCATSRASLHMSMSCTSIEVRMYLCGAAENDRARGRGKLECGARRQAAHHGVRTIHAPRLTQQDKVPTQVGLHFRAFRIDVRSRGGSDIHIGCRYVNGCKTRGGTPEQCVHARASEECYLGRVPGH